MIQKAFSPLAFENRYWPPPVTGLQNGPLQEALARYLTIQVQRDRLLEDAFDQLWHRRKRELLRPLRVKILSEADMGLDQGGVAQEFFRLAMIEALNPDNGMFTVDERTRMAWFKPYPCEPDFKYEILGLIVALSVHNGFTLPVTFPMALYIKLLGGKVRHIRQIKDGWPELASGLEELRVWDEQRGKVDDVFFRTYTFTYETLRGPVDYNMAQKYEKDHTESAELDAPMVTSANRERFIKDYIDFLTDRVIAAQYKAFARGFHAVLPPSVLVTTVPKTLQRITEGISQDIDTHALQRVTKYHHGYCASDKYIKTFWSIVHRYPQSRKRQLLEFVTASDRLPVNGIRSVAFYIQRHGGGEDEERLPTAVTCFGRMLLPEYRDEATLRRKLDIALDNARGFGLS